MGREIWRNRQGVEVSWKPKEDSKVTTLVLLNLPDSLSPYIVLSILKRINFLPLPSSLRKGRRERLDKT